MKNIKPEERAEQAVQINEAPTAEKIKPGEERAAESERAKKMERARQNVLDEIASLENAATPASAPAGGITVSPAKRQKQIENVLSQGLEKIYLSMTLPKRREFKLAGERTAAEINRLFDKARVKIGRIVKLIKKWLSLIPGVNKYFLEQEAKIKADEIIKMKN